MQVECEFPDGDKEIVEFSHEPHIGDWVSTDIGSFEIVARKFSQGETYWGNVLKVSLIVTLAGQG